MTKVTPNAPDHVIEHLNSVLTLFSEGTTGYRPRPTRDCLVVSWPEIPAKRDIDRHRPVARNVYMKFRPSKALADPARLRIL